MRPEPSCPEQEPTHPDGPTRPDRTTVGQPTSPDGDWFRLEQCSGGDASPDSFSFLRPPAGPDELGRLGNYKVRKLIGRGGMAYVFEADDVDLDRQVALKVMRPELKSTDDWQRFLREARTMAAIKHDHLVTIYQAGQDGVAVYFAMELLEGESLAQWIDKNGRVDLREILRLGRELADGLSALHGRGLVHRDIKPANIWLEGRHRRVKILDLGLARAVRDKSRLTQTGLAVGTPGFMSPEQARGEPTDAKSDLFSLGCVLYCLATGRDAFEGSSTLAVLTALAVNDPPPVTELNPILPEDLSDLVMRLLDKEPANRPASAAEVREALEQIEASLTTRITAAPTSRTLVLPRAAAAAMSTRQTPPAPPSARSSRLIALAAFIAIGVIGAGLIGLVIAKSIRPKPAQSPAGVADAAEAPTEVTFIRDLPIQASENWPVKLPPLPDGSVPGAVIRVRGKVAEHGILMHPPPTPGGVASLSYKLGGQFRSFRAEVSINDGPMYREAPCTFWVYGDGRLLWKSKPIWGQRDAEICTANVRDVDVLRIAVTCDGPPTGAHAVWIEPSLMR